MGEQCSAEGLHQAGRSSGVTRSDTFAKRPQQRLSRGGKKIFPLTQFRKRNGYGCLVFLIFGTVSCGSFPRACCLEQRTPAIEPRFCTCKELIHSNVGCSCCNTHEDRKSTRLNSSHANISYAVFCLKKKKTHHLPATMFDYENISRPTQ